MHPYTIKLPFRHSHRQPFLGANSTLPRHCRSFISPHSSFSSRYLFSPLSRQAIEFHRKRDLMMLSLAFHFHRVTGMALIPPGFSCIGIWRKAFSRRGILMIYRLYSRYYFAFTFRFISERRAIAFTSPPFLAVPFSGSARRLRLSFHAQGSMAYISAHFSRNFGHCKEEDITLPLLFTSLFDAFASSAVASHRQLHYSPDNDDCFICFHSHEPLAHYHCFLFIGFSGLPARQIRENTANRRYFGHFASLPPAFALLVFRHISGLWAFVFFSLGFQRNFCRSKFLSFLFAFGSFHIAPHIFRAFSRRFTSSLFKDVAYDQHWKTWYTGGLCNSIINRFVVYYHHDGLDGIFVAIIQLIIALLSPWISARRFFIAYETFAAFAISVIAALISLSKFRFRAFSISLRSQLLFFYRHVSYLGFRLKLPQLLAGRWWYMIGFKLVSYTLHFDCFLA